VHLLVATPREPNLSSFMQYVNGNFSRAYNRRHGKTGRFWGGRFHSTVIESDTQLFNTLFYIEFNMVRCGKVDEPGDWKWSSYRAHASGEEDPVLDLHEFYLALGATPEERQRTYREMAADYLEERGIARQPAFASGVMLGSRSFVERLLDVCARTAGYFQNRTVFELEANVCSLRKVLPIPGG
jgi:putative transposase